MLQEEHGVDVSDIYFKQQKHDDLVSFADNVLESWSDEVGSQVVLMTFSPLSFRVNEVLKTQTK